MKFTIVRGDRHGSEELPFDYQPQDADSGRRPMVLDVLLQAEATVMPDLAYRYGCRNGLCGVCTVEVNGKPRLACRTKVRDGDRVSALTTLPTLRDLVVKRDAINRQLRGRIPAVQFEEEKSTRASNSSNAAYLSLHRCIECYTCLHGCPLHAKNDPASEDFGHGNPFTFLKLQTVRVNPDACEDDKAAVDATAGALGLDTCLDCKGCSCGVGIDLKTEVIAPLLEATERVVDARQWPAGHPRSPTDDHCDTGTDANGS